jgi:NAD-dependent DNA ligase
MNRDAIKIEISDMLGLIDVSGEEVLDGEKIEQFEGYIDQCNKAMAEIPLVEDAVYDRMKDILKRVKPESVLLSEVWGEPEIKEEDLKEDTYTFLKQYPMSSIQTIKDYSVPELSKFIDALPEDEEIELHYSVKENGHGIRIVYQNGELVSATSRARRGAGKDLTAQLRTVVGERCEALAELGLCEVRGELLLPFDNLEKARGFNPDIKTAFTGVSSMVRESASVEEWGLLRFVAYQFYADNYEFDTKADEYEFLEGLGFEVPMAWVQECVTKETALECIKSMVSDCEEDVEGYAYFTDGIVCEVNSRELYRQLGMNDNNCHVGNIALKVGLWKQDLYSGIVQTILWTQGKKKLSPVAIVAESPNLIEVSEGKENYITSLKDVKNMNSMGILTANGNKVRRVPLYEPNNVWVLGAYPGETLFFRFGGESGVVPCFPNGKPLVEGRIEQMLDDDESEVVGD